MNIYLIGSLRNPKVPRVAQALRDLGFNVYDEWYAVGPEADDRWKDYEVGRGRTYQESLQGHHARNVFTLDEFHLNRAHGGVLLYPAGKSAHLELGYITGQRKPGFILDFDGKRPDRFEVMSQFALSVSTTLNDLLSRVSQYPWPTLPPMPEMHAEDVIPLATLLEGEGSFCISGNVPRLVLQMTDRDVVGWAAKILGSAVWGGHLKKVNRKAVWACGASGIKAIEWMRVLRPYLKSRRQAQIRNVMEKWLIRKRYNRRDNPFWARLFGLEVLK